MKKLLITALTLGINSFAFADTPIAPTLSNNSNILELKLQNNGVQWARSPKPKLLNGDLEGKSRTIITIIDADTRGKVTNVAIAQSSGLPDLDDILIQAIKVARFKPYKENGVNYSFRVQQPFELIYDHNGTNNKSSKRNNSPTKCTYNFNSDVIQQQMQGQKTQFTYKQQPFLNILDSELNGESRSVSFKFKLSRKNIISDIIIVESSGLPTIDNKVFESIKYAQIRAPRKFYQLFKREFQDKIQFKLNECT